MAAYVVDFQISFYLSRIIDGVDSPEEAEEYASDLLNDVRFSRQLADEVLDETFLPENVEAKAYCEVTNPEEWDHYETITKE